MSTLDIEQDFPNLKGSGYRITSPDTTDYNCFAWAVGKSDQWYSPLPLNGLHWPNDLPKNTDPQTMLALFLREGGFTPCKDGSLETGFEKLALYVNNQKVTHAARQLPTGAWTSKLGSMEDIEHPNLKVLEGLKSEDYGEAIRFLKRPQ